MHVAALEGEEVLITVEPIVSLGQYGYFHAVICKECSERTGIELPEMRETLKDLHNHGQSLTTLNRKGMYEFMGRCIRWAALFLGITIPDPQ